MICYIFDTDQFHLGLVNAIICITTILPVNMILIAQESDKIIQALSPGVEEHSLAFCVILQSWKVVKMCLIPWDGQHMTK